MKDLKPGRALDALVAEKVMGWKNSKEQIIVVESWNKDSGEHSLDIPDLPHYSTLIADAWEVVEKLSETKKLILRGTTMSISQQDVWIAHFVSNGPVDESEFLESECMAETAPHVLCLAALKAMGIE